MLDGQPSGERQLWASVVERAVLDAQLTYAGTYRTRNDIISARVWLRRGGYHFRMVCAMAGIDHEALNEWALRNVSEGADDLKTDCELETEKRREQCVDLFNDGLSLSQIAHALRIGRTTARRYLLEKGIEIPRPCERLSPEEEARVLAMRLQGLTAKEIGREVGRKETSIFTVLRRWRERGVNTKRPNKGAANA